MPVRMCAILLAGMLVALVPQFATAQQTPASPAVAAFPTPEAAVDALVQAIRAPTTEPLEKILGKDVLDSIPPEERNSDRVRRAAGERLASKSISIVYEDESRTRARVTVGEDQFRLPTPLVRTDRGWTFDGRAAVAEMRERRAGINEANALEALRSFARAQQIYYQRDRNGDGVIEYAQRIRGTPGELDGLVNEEAERPPGAAVSLLNGAFAQAEGQPGDPKHSPRGGYAYRVLHSQGSNAEGGSLSYIRNGRMTEGFAIVAWPTAPGESGLSTFIMNHRGDVFEREFGAGTFDAVRAISAFDPGPGWVKVDD